MINARRFPEARAGVVASAGATSTPPSTRAAPPPPRDAGAAVWHPDASAHATHPAATHHAFTRTFTPSTDRLSRVDAILTQIISLDARRHLDT
jgi:hypothetical protein